MNVPSGNKTRAATKQTDEPKDADGEVIEW